MTTPALARYRELAASLLARRSQPGWEAAGDRETLGEMDDLYLTLEPAERELAEATILWPGTPTPKDPTAP